MNRREMRDYVESTWQVMREPPFRDGNRRERRARVAKAKRDARFARRPRPPAPVVMNRPAGSGGPVSVSVVEASEASPQRHADSATDSEAGR